MKRIFISIIVTSIVFNAQSQNVGVNTNNPQATLDVNGTTKTNQLTIATGGNASDFLIKQNAAGQITHRKGHVGMGIRYIICVNGTFPSENGTPGISGPYLGEIKVLASPQPHTIPAGWMACEGQLLPINTNQGLFSLLGITYGGNGQTNFAIPDLRGATIVHYGNGWNFAEKSN